MWTHELEMAGAKIKGRKSTSANSKSAKGQGARKKRPKNLGTQERESANAKARNLRPKKERESASVKSFVEERESASAKTKKSACPALIKINQCFHCFGGHQSITKQLIYRKVKLPVREITWNYCIHKNQAYWRACFRNHWILMKLSDLRPIFISRRRYHIPFNFPK
jgi:hypothetical protein